MLYFTYDKNKHCKSSVATLTPKYGYMFDTFILDPHNIKGELIHGVLSTNY